MSTVASTPSLSPSGPSAREFEEAYAELYDYVVALGLWYHTLGRWVLAPVLRSVFRLLIPLRKVLPPSVNPSVLDTRGPTPSPSSEGSKAGPSTGDSSSSSQTEADTKRAAAAARDASDGPASPTSPPSPSSPASPSSPPLGSRLVDLVTVSEDDAIFVEESTQTCITLWSLATITLFIGISALPRAVGAGLVGMSFGDGSGASAKDAAGGRSRMILIGAALFILLWLSGAVGGLIELAAGTARWFFFLSFVTPFVIALCLGLHAALSTRPQPKVPQQWLTAAFGQEVADSTTSNPHGFNTAPTPLPSSTLIAPSTSPDVASPYPPPPPEFPPIALWRILWAAFAQSVAALIVHLKDAHVVAAFVDETPRAVVSHVLVFAMVIGFFWFPVLESAFLFLVACLTLFCLGPVVFSVIYGIKDRVQVIERASLARAAAQGAGTVDELRPSAIPKRRGSRAQAKTQPGSPKPQSPKPPGLNVDRPPRKRTSVAGSDDSPGVVIDSLEARIPDEKERGELGEEDELGVEVEVSVEEDEEEEGVSVELDEDGFSLSDFDPAEIERLMTTGAFKRISEQRRALRDDQ